MPFLIIFFDNCTYLQISEHGGKLGLRLSKKLMEMMKTLAPPGDQKVYAF